MDWANMKSVNFEFLRVRRPELAALGGFAEQYAHPDPTSALVKLRTFAEQIVLGIYKDLGLPRPVQADLIGLLNNDVFRAVVPAGILDKLHVLRIKGNKAAHGQAATVETAIELLRDAFDLGRWLAVTYLNAQLSSLHSFLVPGSTAGVEDDSKGQIKRDRKAALERLAAQEAQMADLLRDLEAERERASIAEKKASELEASCADVIAMTENMVREVEHRYSETYQPMKLVHKLSLTK